MTSFVNSIKSVFMGVINSYSQIFFSNSLLLSVLLLITSFFDWYAGVCGLFAVVISNITSVILQFNRSKIENGLYGFNSLLVGLGFGLYFQFNWQLLLVLILISIFTMFLSLMFEGVIGKYGLPFLSIPFILGMWALMLSTKEYSELILSERGTFVYNELYRTGGVELVNLYDWWQNIEILPSLKTYFISLGAILFQYNLLSGIIIALGLLLYSRIAFSLSLIGFYSAYLFYSFVGININEVSYAYIGFNYILTSIAIGGFFLVPSKTSYFWTVILVPMVALLTSSLSEVFGLYGLSIYSLPFNIIVLLFLYVLKLRINPSNNLNEVIFQQFSPEENLYKYNNDKKRFSESHRIPVSLPFMGKWKVTQGHDGEHTHKDEWKHAWDFEVVDDNGNKYKGSGDNVEDYYCYDKPVLAVADGVVEQIIDNVDDNKIGDVNIENNWGNTIIIKHTYYLYSKLSHLKSGSFKVKIGDFVTQGTTLASCGNSGRSPVPHLHFQLQSTPYVGSKTLEYPIVQFIKLEGNEYVMNSYEKPIKDDIISNVESNSLLNKGFNLIPGKNIQIISQDNKQEVEDWEVFVDIYNNSYIHCKQKNATAFFVKNNGLFYFSHYKGKKNTMLYHFFMAAYKVPLGYYQGLKVEDDFSVNNFIKKRYLWIQDVFAPFIMFFKAKYLIEYAEIDDANWTSSIVLKSKVNSWFFNKKLSEVNYSIHLNNEGIEKLIISDKKQTIEAVCINS